MRAKWRVSGVVGLMAAKALAALAVAAVARSLLKSRRFMVDWMGGTGNREQGTGNREQGTGNREQGTGMLVWRIGWSGWGQQILCEDDRKKSKDAWGET